MCHITALFNRFAHSAGPGVENIVGTVWPQLRGKGARRGDEKSTPGGPKKEAPGIKFRPPGVKFRPPGSSKWASGLLLGRLGRQVGLWRTLWAAKGELENCMEGSWDRLGALLARLGPVLDRFSSPGRGAGRVILKGFWGLPGREAKTEQFLNI